MATLAARLLERTAEGAAARLAARTRMSLRATNATKRAAVCVPLALVDGTPSVLFTVRQSHMRQHRGEVAFPGGHVDEGEGAQTAALRELQEEMGVDTAVIAATRKLGMCDDAHSMTGVPVTPVACMLPPLDAVLSGVRPNPAEVACAFALPVAHLLSRGSRTTYFQPVKEVRTGVPHPRGGLDMPAFTGGPVRIWGLTSFILARFLDTALAPAWEEAIAEARLEPAHAAALARFPSASEAQPWLEKRAPE